MMASTTTVRLCSLLKRFPTKAIVGCRAFSASRLFLETFCMPKNCVAKDLRRNLSTAGTTEHFQDEPVEEYYEVEEEEGVEVPMVAEKEPYLRDDLVKRPLNSLTVDELVFVLRDQRAKNVTVLRLVAEDGTTYSHSFAIVCSSFNSRHSKALSVILRAFLKRNFVIVNHAIEVPRRHSIALRWNVLNMAGIIVHILDEELRQSYDLESLFLGLDVDDNEGTFNQPSWQNEFRVPEQRLIKSPSQLPPGAVWPQQDTKI